MCYGSDKKYCGRNLARALALYCFEVNVVKRSEGTMYGSILAPFYKELEEPGFRLLWPHFKTRSLALPSKGKRLVVEECCNKICSIAKLQSFCY
ncbi:unnamed protein product [Arctia plantaginis]|uniref:Insulin-like domain-containing protein n=1 Tax=Arctia plantaginis TaxID=874455 RepID=A0A8S0YTH1_ARCPL|nr:unnamed protein product [Arctia plantaginis]